MQYENIFRRNEVRLATNLPVTSPKGTIRNISSHGVCVKIQDADFLNAKVDDRITLKSNRILNNGETTNLHGRVVHKSERGIFRKGCFIGLNIDQNSCLSKFVDDLIDKKSHKSYEILSSFYEAITAFLSFNYVIKVKRYSLKHIKPKKTILIAGCGGGKFAGEVAKKEVDLHCLDLSEKMLEETKKRVDLTKNEQTNVEYHNINILKYHEKDKFDYLFLNYFLNVFSYNIMIEVLRHNLKLIKPGGLLIIADEKPVSEFNLPFRIFYWPIRIFMWAIIYCLPTKTPLHNVYNYRGIIDNIDNFEILELKDIGTQRVVIARKIR